MSLLSDYPVIFELFDSSGKKRKISISGIFVEILNKHLPDFRAWLQEQYLIVEVEAEGLSARAVGNKVRDRIKNEVKKSPHYKAEMDRIAKML